ncbi:hypothetical protein AF335_13490 [Streptomyces eurocidicus]|uniref:Uncharacterized protein n=1 Tax=Streptomyces eurocidicus TaxID=66423 RepID=A0A2N8NYG1_STREU|nr:hypothetical protein [Streptomyces eurocidicus]MBB5121364.1 hypothetical protein [Streptomyces eurocidicus]MBF6050969.1 hypothetical protein [Streptomyces eurocidicus]PNE33807.1 hypothetical protein AF335_13490 [Streptomyces eurocidicus]
MSASETTPEHTGSAGWRDDTEPRLALTAEENHVVTARWEAARAAQKQLDALVRSLLDALAGSHGAVWEGKQYRLKGLRAFRREAAAELHEGVPLEKVVAKVNDLNRYTLTFDPAHYTEGVRQTYALLHARGQVIVVGSERNSWEDPVYKGFHATWQQPDGQVRFEIQFHTPESFRAKSENHLLYDLYRSRHTRRSLAGERNATKAHEQAAQAVQSGRYGRTPAKESY